MLNCLQEVEIINMNGVEHEIAFLKQLFNWATLLKIVTVAFHSSVTETKAWEVHQMLSSLFGPEMCIRFYIHGDDPKLLKLLR